MSFKEKHGRRDVYINNWHMQVSKNILRVSRNQKDGFVGL